MKYMTIAYLILVHKGPEQLLRMINSLQNDEDYFVVHLDARVSLSDFFGFFTDYENVHFLEDRAVSAWGSFGLVEAVLNGLVYVQKKTKAQRVVMLSGQDFPIKSVQYIKAYFESNPSKIFMEYAKIPNNIWHNGGIGRFPRYDEVKDVMTLYAGSQWLSFPVNIIQIIFDFLLLNPLYKSYFASTSIPDESFFHTLFFNCGVDGITEEITNRALTLIEWPKNTSHPKVLGEEDIELLRESDCLFARKFEDTTSDGVIL